MAPLLTQRPGFDAMLAWYFVTVWGSGFIATKIGLQYAPPFTFLTLRFLFGLAYVLIGERAKSVDATRLIVLTGFMGAFTTFSTYAFDVGSLAQSGRVLGALANFAAQNGIGIAALLVGLALGRVLWQ